jgi:hypothetical protein
MSPSSTSTAPSYEEDKAASKVIMYRMIRDAYTIWKAEHARDPIAAMAACGDAHLAAEEAAAAYRANLLASRIASLSQVTHDSING